MKYYSGIDLHTRDSVVCVIDEKERKVVMETAPNDLLSILNHASHMENLKIQDNRHRYKKGAVCNRAN